MRCTRVIEMLRHHAPSRRLFAEKSDWRRAVRYTQISRDLMKRLPGDGSPCGICHWAITKDIDTYEGHLLPMLTSCVSLLVCLAILQPASSL